MVGPHTSIPASAWGAGGVLLVSREELPLQILGDGEMVTPRVDCVVLDLVSLLRSPPIPALNWKQLRSLDQPLKNC